MEAYSQFLNKIIRGQAKAIETIGGDPYVIMDKCPSEMEEPSTKIPRQMQVCTELNALNKDTVNKLVKESQQTLCMLTNMPDLTSDLFQLELDKRDLIQKREMEHKQKVQALNQQIEKLEEDFENYKT